jgi:sugar O-acyltransferase (sialic acid O-acetyltransferase NeuD family)
MLIAGAGNLGLHTLDQLIDDDYKGEIIFFDEKNGLPQIIAGKYNFIDSFEKLAAYFTKGYRQFVVTVGQPRVRERLLNKIESEGGQLATLISKRIVFFSSFSTIGPGCIIQPGCAVSHNVKIGKACILHASTLIGHDVIIEDFVTIGSNVNILKGVTIGKHTTISPNVLIYQNVRIGSNSYIAPGVIITSDVPDNQTISLI